MSPTGSGRGQNFRLIEALSAPTLEKHYNRLVQISAELERKISVYYYSIPTPPPNRQKHLFLVIYGRMA